MALGQRRRARRACAAAAWRCVGTATSIARLLASVAFGALWTLSGLTDAIACFAVGARGGDRAGRGAARPHARSRRMLRRRRGVALRRPRRGVRAGGRRGRRRRASRREARGAVVGRRRRGACPSARRPAARRSLFRSTGAPRPGRDRAGRRGRDEADASRRCTATASYFAGGRGLCLARGGGFAAGYRAEVFDAGPAGDATRSASTGIPSRARVSPDGRYGGGDAVRHRPRLRRPGAFSTQTTIIDMATGTKIADLEQFTVLRGEQAGHRRRRQLLGRDLRRATATASTRRWPPAARPT